jgi:hypothetical protein
MNEQSSYMGNIGYIRYRTKINKTNKRLRPVSYVPNVAHVTGLFIHGWPFGFLLTFICFVYLCPVSCVPNVAHVTGLFIHGWPFGFLLTFICFVYLRPVSYVPNVAHVTGLFIHGWPFGFLLTFICFVVINVKRKPKGQPRMNNPVTWATLGTQDTGRR